MVAHAFLTITTAHTNLEANTVAGGKGRPSGWSPLEGESGRAARHRRRRKSGGIFSCVFSMDNGSKPQYSW